MDLLIAALALGTLALGAYMTARRAHRDTEATTPSASKSEERGISQLRPGDVLLQDGSLSLIARQVWLWRDHEHQWREACLQADEQPCWLVADLRADGEVVIGQRIACPPILEHPPQQLDHAGQVYRLVRRGRADCQLEPTKSGSSATEMGYWDYRGVGDLRIWLRHGANGYSCFAGRSTPPHTLEFLPGS